MGHFVISLFAAAIAGISPLAANPQHPPSGWVSSGEASEFVATGTATEAEAQCKWLEKEYQKYAKCIEFGITQEGRVMHAVVLSADGVLSAAQALQRHRPVVLLQAGIHAGEIEGKDAGFAVARDWLKALSSAKAAIAPRSVLAAVTVVFVPIFNIDGHERRSANNRPNQRGPSEMGFRTTANNLNLNRDYMKADSTEMRAMLGLLNAWDPVLYVDLHTTDGAKFQHDVAVMVAPRVSGPADLNGAAQTLNQNMVNALNGGGPFGRHHALSFYPAFDKDDDPMSGFTVGEAPPRFSHGYWALRNRLGMLVETHSWRPYAERVATTRDVLEVALAQAAQHASRWRALADELDAAAARRPTRVVLTTKATDKTSTLPFLGYAYTRTPSAVSGTLMTRYDESVPQVWKLPFRSELIVDAVAEPPAAGYVVPAGYADVVKPRLLAHGLMFQELTMSTAIGGERFVANDAKFSAKPYEGRQQATLQGQWQKTSSDVRQGSLFVPIHQKGSRLVVHLLEPLAPDALVRWGLFNAAFEQKEYMEAYVAEEVAEAMLKDEAVAKAFATRLESDEDFRKNPEARLHFFFQRHSSFDNRLNVYPVLRSDVAPAIAVTK